MSDDRATATSLGERLVVYRRRLALAAVISLALHLLLFRGLAVARLGSDVPKPADAAGSAPLKPNRTPRDFPLATPRPSRTRPAHERPLDLAMRPPADRRTPARPSQQPQRATDARRPDEPREETVARDRPRPNPADDRPARRQAEAPAAAGATAPAIAAPVGSEAAAAAVAPASTAARPDAAPVAGQWRPREVALLERLASSPRPAPTPDATPAARQAATAAAASTAVDAVEQTPAAAGSAAAVAPASRATADRPAARAASARELAADAADPSRPPVTGGSRTAVAAASMPAARRPGTAVGGPAATVTSAAAPPVTAVGGAATAPAAATGIAARAAGATAAAAITPRSGAGIAADPDAGSAGAAGGGWTAASTGFRGGASRGAAAAAGAAGPARAPVAGPTAAGGAGRAATIDVARAAVAGAGGAGGTGAGPTAASGGAATSLAVGPAPLDRGNAGAGGRSALGDTGRGITADDADEDGLSGDGAAQAASRRREFADDAGLPRRIAAAALPVEGRVRDVAEAFAGRTGPRGGKVADKATLARADAVVDRGLDFLAASQQADGRWSLGRFAGATAADVPRLESDTAATGLALLAFLGAGHDHFDGRHRDTVRRGLEFLLAVQRPDGDLYLPADDLSNSCAWLYSHGIASMALCEAVGMTGDELIKPAAARACGFIAASQHPTLGGWRYTPGTDADLSVSGWMLVAVRSGGLAGVATDPQTLPGVRRLLTASAARDDATRYAYNPRNAQQRRSRLSAACMTAVGTLMRLHTGDPATDPRVAQAGRAIAAIAPTYGTAAEKVRDSYLWYYASQVLVHTGGTDWDRWYARLVDTLTAAQDRSGPKAGSWDPLAPVPDRWGEYGGRIYVTALHLLALEVPYRHLPTYAVAPARAAGR